MSLTVLDKNCPECRAPLLSDGCCANRTECGYYDSEIAAAHAAAQDKLEQTAAK